MNISSILSGIKTWFYERVMCEVVTVTTIPALLALTPNKSYRIPSAVSLLRIGPVAPTNTNIVNHYHLMFKSASTGTTTFQYTSTIIWDETPTINADKVYEVSIIYHDGSYYGTIKEFG